MTTEATSSGFPIARLLLTELVLAGTRKNYPVNFNATEPPFLSIVAGPTQTGKSSVLRFIDYCLGSSRLPRQLEFRSSVRAAYATMETPRGPLRIERAAAGEPSSSAWIREAAAGRDFEGRPEIKPVKGPSDPTSLSSMLLSYCDLEGYQLKESPTQPDSGLDPLSFRDLMPLCLLGDDRIGSIHFQFDNEPHKRIKLRQVVDVVFGVHDREDVDLAARITDLSNRATALRRDIATLETFLAEQGIPEDIALDARTQALDLESQALAVRLEQIDSTVRSVTSFAEELRADVAETGGALSRVRARKRYLEIQISRLASLEAQYAADKARLDFLDEAGVLFNDLHVVTCPACMSQIPEPYEQDGTCSLCNSSVVKSRTPESDTATVALLKRESSAHVRRWNELTKYGVELKDSLSELARQVDTLTEREQSSIRRLEMATRASLPPSIQERDALVSHLTENSQERTEIASQKAMWVSLEKRRSNLVRIESQLKLLRAEERETRQLGLDRVTVVRMLEERFLAILREFEFPRLDGAALDVELRPIVRDAGLRDQSDGARTLISLAWTLAIFELSWERSMAHPGFLMIDSPQRGLGSRNSDDPEFRDTRLVENFYRHLLGWLSGPGAGAQVIIADNSPPASARPYIVAEFTGDPDKPPYGLIDDDVPTRQDEEAELGDATPTDPPQS